MKPETWKTSKLGELLDVQNGFAFDSRQFSDSQGTPLIRIRDLKRGVGTSVRYNGDYDPRFLVRGGDLLIAMDGEFRCHPWRGEEALLNQRVCRLIDFSDEIEPAFVGLGINAHLKRIEAVTPYVTVKHLSANAIKKIEFSFPDRTEQRRIVALIDQCLNRTEEIERLAAHSLEQSLALRTALLHDYFSELTGAEPRELGALLKLSSGKFLPSRNMESNGAHPVYGGNGLAGFHDEYMFESPRVVIGRVGAKCGCVHVTQPKSWVTDNALFVREVMADFDHRFLAYALEAADLRQYARQAAQPVISAKSISAATIPYVPLPKQLAIADEISTALTAITELVQSLRERQRQALSLRDAVVSRGFAGEL